MEMCHIHIYKFGMKYYLHVTTENFCLVLPQKKHCVATVLTILVTRGLIKVVWSLSNIAVVGTCRAFNGQTVRHSN
jgi:hypothetical protein